MPYWFDGNNLTGQSVENAKARPHVQHAFISTIYTYKKSGGGRFVIFFDGDDTCRSASPPGIAVRYSAPFSADEAIVQRLHEVEKPSEVIVVTNDRILMSRCRNEGASILSWHAFTKKMGSRRKIHSGSNELNDDVNVEEWLHYFGLDK